MIAAFQSAHTIAVRIKNITLYEGDQHMQMKFTGKWIARLAAGAAALIAGIAAAWKGCRLLTVAGICCAVVFLLELIL